MVLALGVGTTTSPGIVRIVRLRPLGKRLVAEYADCSGPAMAMSGACHVVEVPRDDREVVFERLPWDARKLYCGCP